MDIEQFRAFCLSLYGTTEGMKWERLCFMVEGKIFVVVDLENNAFAFKCTPEVFDTLVERDGFMQAAHFAKRQWLRVENFNMLSSSELRNLAEDSRDLVIAKLPKKLKEKYTS